MVDADANCHPLVSEGPVLERGGEPLGVVTGIAGQTRMLVTVFGTQGHAGTVPMSIRADPTPAAAEMIVAVEKRCSGPGGAPSLLGQFIDRLGDLEPPFFAPKSSPDAAREIV